MSGNTPNPYDARIAEARRSQAERERGYRAQALKIYPHVCGRCGREFAGKRLSELTVHHRDHNHDYNPPDGSNWELLCIYCHDNEHSRDQVAAAYDPAGAVRPVTARAGSTSRPFADLGAKLKP